MLERAEPDVASSTVGSSTTTPRKLTSRATTAPGENGLARDRRAVDDGLARLLARAVHMRRSGHGGARLLQRFYDPNIADNARQAAVTYLFTNARPIAGAYLWANADDEAIQGVLEKTFVTLTSVFPNPAPGLTQRKTVVWQKVLAGDVPWQNAVVATNGTAIAENLKRQVLETAVRTLNVLEQDTITKAVGQRALAGTVDVGTEFTFTNPAIRKVKPGVSDTAAVNMIKAWRKLVEEDTKIKPPPAVKSVKGKADKAGENAVKNAVEFTYTRGNRTWWWVLDMDPACLETQTKPSTQTELNEWAGVMQAHIFGFATQLGLEVDASAKGGGGHISLDLATLFGGSPDILLGVLSALQNDVAGWAQQFAYDDAPNSPWLREQGTSTNKAKGQALTAYIALVTNLQQQINTGGITFEDVTRRLRDFHATTVNLWADDIIETHKTASPKEKKLDEYKEQHQNALNVTANPSHYQAVNIEHITPDTDATKRRMELRAIGAQASPERLGRDLNYIYALIDEVRRDVLQQVSTRRSDWT
jgi:hypothetical protein